MRMRTVGAGEGAGRPESQTGFIHSIAIGRAQGSDCGRQLDGELASRDRGGHVFWICCFFRRGCQFSFNSDIFRF